MADDDLTKTGDDAPSSEDDILASIDSSVKASEDATETTETTKDDASTEDDGTPKVDATKSADEDATGPQDLVDSKGDIIAKGGAERRHFETSQRRGQEITQLQGTITNLNAKLEALEGANTIGTQLGLKPEQLTAGARIMAAYIKDPKETINYLLTQAKAAGHNVDGIGGSNVDTSAIGQMIDQRLAPLVDAQNAERKQVEATTAAKQQYDDFIVNYPDAKVHEGALARLLNTDTTLSPEGALLKLRTFYLDNKLDWAVPLEEHQKRVSGQGKVDPATGSSNGQQPSLLNGAIPPATTDTDEVASASTPTDDIVRQAMRDEGILK